MDEDDQTDEAHRRAQLARIVQAVGADPGQVVPVGDHGDDPLSQAIAALAIWRNRNPTIVPPLEREAAPMRPIPLRELDAELTTIGYGDVIVDALCFRCPVPGHDHQQLVPYSDEVAHKITLRNGGEVLLWHRSGGTTVDDLSLAPSFQVPSCGIHGHVVEGTWRPC